MTAQGSRAKTAELAGVLTASLDDGITVLDRRPFPYRSTFPLEELVIRGFHLARGVLAPYVV